VIVVDSSVWIDFFNGTESCETDFLDRTIGIQNIGVGDLILAEVLQGFRSDKDYETARKALLEFDQIEMLGQSRAIRAATKFRKLRKAGITIRKTNDVIIASYCIDAKAPLLYSDKDFDPFVSKLGLLSAIQ